jgi:Ca2+-dependent lipid-binding protein
VKKLYMLCASLLKFSLPFSRLKTDIVGSTDAYCKLQVNDVWYTSPKVPNTLDPIWNMSYEFPLEVSNKEQV